MAKTGRVNKKRGMPDLGMLQVDGKNSGAVLCPNRISFNDTSIFCGELAFLHRLFHFFRQNRNTAFNFFRLRHIVHAHALMSVRPVLI
ncbi:hypothetical protein KHDHEBDM_02960 [Pectobacterium polaris]|nr:hypothetical protein KHDHEBDM_02960 [Pectobacterium polaris]